MLEGKGLFVGCLVPEIEIDFLDDGEIIVSGVHVVESYLNKKDNLENKLTLEGKVWHKTGDIGYLDENNHLWLLGRKSAVIEKNNKKIYPFAIEVAAREKSQKMAALMQKEHKIILLTEAKDFVSLFSTLFHDVDEVHYIEKIPLDKRHNAKIDYTKLKKLINF